MKALVIIMCAVALAASAEPDAAAQAAREKTRAELMQIQDSLRRKREALDAKIQLREQAKGNRLRSGRIIRPPAVELTEKEKALDLDSFAGFKFGDVADSSNLLHVHCTKGIKLEQPIRAFSHVQIAYTGFNPRLYSIHIWGSVKDWDAQSISNEVVAIRNYLSSHYGISSWKDYSGYNSESLFKFENDNLSISVSGNVSFLVLDVESKRIATADSAEKNAVRKAISFPEAEGFAELARLSDTAKVVIHSETKPTIPSGESGYIGLTDPNLIEWERSETNGTDHIVYLPCRSESVGVYGRLHWRPFVISSDGRIRKIGRESNATTLYYANPPF